jgi:preprotein translocase subunit SecD
VPIAAALALATIGVVALGFLPWMQGTAVHAAVRFEVRLAEEQPVPGLIVAQIGNSDRLIYLHPEIIVNNDDIAESSVVDQGAAVAIALKFEPAGAERMRQATQGHVGRPMAILIDGRVVMAPTLRGPVSDSAMITGVYTRAQAERVVEGIGRR